MQNGQRSLVLQGVVQRPDNIIIKHLGIFQQGAKRLPRHRHSIKFQLVTKAGHEAAQAASIIEIFHQILASTWPHIGDHRYIARHHIKVGQFQINSGAARHSNKMDHRIGRTAHRHRYHNSIVKGPVIEDFVRRQIIPDHIDNAPAAFSRHADMI